MTILTSTAIVVKKLIINKVYIFIFQVPTLFQGSQGPTPQNLADLDEAYSVLEAYLQNNKYIAANNFTIADISLGSTAASLHAIHKFDANK